jgi:hypothetical protein
MVEGIWLAVIIALITSIVLILLSRASTRGHGNRAMSNLSQLRGIHQGMVNFAQGNNVGTADGFFPGLNEMGEVVPNGPTTGYSGDGTFPGARLWLLLEGNFITPEYVINPSDSPEFKPIGQELSGKHSALTDQNYSYAMLALPRNDDEKIEWSETLNTYAVVMSDRALGTDIGKLHSIWDEDEWIGSIVRNDNSTSYEAGPKFEETRYGSGEVNAVDHIFIDDPDANDAYLVHRNGVDAFEAE